MGGVACNRLDLQGLADHDAETRAVKPKLRPKAETETDFGLVWTTGTSIYVCRYVDRQICLPRSTSTSQPRAAVAFRSQVAGINVIDVQQRAGFSNLRQHTFEAACDAQDARSSCVPLSHPSVLPHMTLEMQVSDLLKTQRALW